MHYTFLPPSSIFFVIIVSATFDLLPTSLCVDDARFVACKTRLNCGNFTNLDYPFWGEGRSSECGHPKFQLTNCKGDAPPVITIETRPYRVLGIDPRSLLITVARQDLWNSTCPSSPIYNTNLDYRLFKHPKNDQNLTLYYGCPAVPGGGPLPFDFRCTVDGPTNTDSYFITQATLLATTPILTPATLRTCRDSITVPVNQSAAGVLTNLTSSEDDLKGVLSNGFGLEWEANDTNCNECGRSGGKCGYNSNSSSFVCYCYDRPYPLRCNQTENVIAAIPGILAVICTGWLVWKQIKPSNAVHSLINARLQSEEESSKQIESSAQDVEAFTRNYASLTPKRYNFTEIKKMTNSFKEKLGQGGYGQVYKGKLSDGSLVAVKILNETKGNGEEFINEVASISRTSHVNVVTLLGFCFDRNRRALIYKFMPNKSLDKFIHYESSTTSQQLDWTLLYQIAVGIAQGLEYLHRGCNTRIVHFDIKPQNILLDEEFCPKISDFGLAKLCKKKESIISMLGARGTPGYIAPEVFNRHFGGVSHKSDVYSYGMMILEIAGASKKNRARGAHSSETYFPDWIYEHIENGTDLGIRGAANAEEAEAVRKMILVGLWCIQTIPTDRPSMRKVVDMLEENAQSLQIPPNPLLYSMTRLEVQDSNKSPSLSSENITEATYSNS